MQSYIYLIKVTNMYLGNLKTGGKRVNNISLDRIKHIYMLKVQYLHEHSKVKMRALQCAKAALRRL